MNAKLQTVVDEAVQRLSKHKEVLAVILFGSQANGRARKDSDVDLAIIINPITKKGEAIALSESSSSIDISLFHNLPPIIQFRALKEGKVLLCKDKLSLQRIKSRVTLEYLDFSIFLERHHQRMLQYV